MAAPVCTPSRAALMTGCYPKRIDMATGSNIGVLLAGDTKGLNPDEITIAEVLKGAGYKTGMFGKWHLGDQPEFLPTKQVFDEYFGIPFNTLSAVRSGKCKLHTNNGKPTQLYDLESDIGEKNNIIESNPEVAQRLGRQLKAFAKDIADNSRPAAFVANPKPLSKWNP